MTTDDKNSLKKSPIFECTTCDYKSCKRSEYDKHLLTAKHKKMTEKVAEKISNITCDICNYTTSKITDYNKHLLTAKHKKMTEHGENLSKNLPEGFKCHCGKIYKHRQGLFRHKMGCIGTPDVPTESNFKSVSTELIIEMIKENKEFKSLIVDQQTMLIEQQKENKELMNKMVEITQNQLTLPNTVNNNNNTINNNQKFNLNFFLNETCKDAMNIQEFIENLRITFQDLLKIGNEGFVTGVSDIFIKELRDLDVTKRPIHCTDAKRDTIYVKENSEWNKDDKDNSKIKNIIEKVEYKNVAALQKWCNENPDSMINNSDKNLLRDKIYLQTLQGGDRTREKIIKNIAKEVIVDKEIV
jgi:hypothetical protein